MIALPYSQCIWKLTKLLPQFVSTVNLDRLLSEIHQCFEVYSKHQPPTPQMDVPIRTVKTILFHLINSVGEEVSGRNLHVCVLYVYSSWNHIHTGLCMYYK